MAPAKTQEKIFEKGRKRYARHLIQHRRIFGTPVTGRQLDFGCGAGAFMLAGLQDGQDIWGVEVDEKRDRVYKATAAREFPQWRDRFCLYEGRFLPYPSNHFDGCYSWFVFEHVADPQTSLREIARVLKPGGTLAIHAEDVRNLWEGHALAPWPAYMPREFAAAYLEGLGKPRHSEFVTHYVVYISAPVICDILTTLGLEVLYSNAAPERPAIPEGLYVTTDDEARALGRKMRDRDISGARENLTVYARKPVS